MRRLAGAIALAAIVWGPPAFSLAGPSPPCTCTTARATNGWCSLHELGYVAGVKVTSRWLYEAADAHGHDVDVATFTCPDCRRAVATNGFCEVDRIGFVDNRAYFSRLTYELARGEIRPPSSIRCPTCRKNADTHGWCAKSRVGMIGEVAIRDRAAFDRAVAALDIFMVANAVAARCPYCAVAVITDTECPICRIAYKDGKPVPR